MNNNKNNSKQQKQITSLKNKEKNLEKKTKQLAKASANVKNSKVLNNGESLVHISPLAKKYMLSLCNPFEAGPVCVPDFPTVPSRKLKTFIRGFFTVGTAGFGYVIAQPAAAVANDSPATVNSTAAYAAAAIALIGAGTLPSNSNSDYAIANYGASLGQFRLVSSGLRIRYAGTELNRGGTVVGLQQLQHQSLNTFTFGQMATSPNSRKFHPMGGKWYKLMYCPVLVSELTWQAAIPSVLVSSGYMAFAVQATAGDVYEFELVTNFEVNGPTIRGMTPGSSDPAGLAVVSSAMNAAGSMPTDKPASAIVQDMAKTAVGVALNTTTSVVTAEDKLTHKEGESIGWVSDFFNKAESIIESIGPIAGAVVAGAL